MRRKSVEVVHKYRKTNNYSLRKYGEYIEVIELHKVTKSVTPLSTSGPYASSYSPWHRFVEVANVLLRDTMPNSFQLVH